MRPIGSTVNVLVNGSTVSALAVGHGATATVTSAPTLARTTVPVEVHFDVELRFVGDLPEAERILLEVDSILERGQPPLLQVLYNHEADLRRDAAQAGGSAEVQERSARARQAVSGLMRHRAAVQAELEVFLVDARFRRNAEPFPCAAGTCLLALANGPAEPSARDDERLKFDLWTTGKQGLVSSFWLSGDELEESLWEGRGTVRQRLGELLKYRSEIVTFLPPQVRLRHAYPAIIRSLATTRGRTELKEAWFAPLHWSFGPG